MYIYLKRLKKVKKSRDKSTKKSTAPKETLPIYPDSIAEDSYSESHVDTLIASEVVPEIQVLTAEDVKTELNDHSFELQEEVIEETQPQSLATTSVIMPAIRGPSGEIILLQKLKKVKKAKKSKSPKDKGKKTKSGGCGEMG